MRKAHRFGEAQLVEMAARAWPNHGGPNGETRFIAFHSETVSQGHGERVTKSTAWWENAEGHPVVRISHDRITVRNGRTHTERALGYDLGELGTFDKRRKRNPPARVHQESFDRLWELVSARAVQVRAAENARTQALSPADSYYGFDRT